VAPSCEEPQSARGALKSVALTSAAPKNAGLAQTYAVRQNRRRHRKSHRRQTAKTAENSLGQSPKAVSRPTFLL
jgi:hypothetical protein